MATTKAKIVINKCWVINRTDYRSWDKFEIRGSYENNITVYKIYG